MWLFIRCAGKVFLVILSGIPNLHCLVVELSRNVLHSTLQPYRKSAYYITSSMEFTYLAALSIIPPQNGSTTVIFHQGIQQLWLLLKQPNLEGNPNISYSMDSPFKTLHDSAESLSALGASSQKTRNRVIYLRNGRETAKEDNKQVSLEHKQYQYVKRDGSIAQVIREPCWFQGACKLISPGHCWSSTSVSNSTRSVCSPQLWGKEIFYVCHTLFL